MSMINARGTTNGSAYAMWSVMLYGTCKQTDHGCTSCPTSMLSLRSQPLSSALLLKNKPREQHECTNLMHSDLDAGAAASRRARVPQVSASLRKVAGLRRSQRSRDAREGRREESAGRMQSHRMSQSSWGFEHLVQVCQMVRSR